MHIQVVLSQVLVMFILIAAGVFFQRKNVLTRETSTHLSALVTNICCPALLISSSLAAENKIPRAQLLMSILIILLVYVVAIVFSLIIPVILRVKTGEVFAYKLLTVYGNVGFLGIPLTEAVLGRDALIYASIFNFIFNILIYTYGINIIKSSIVIEKNDVRIRLANKFKVLKSCINVGSIGALLSIIIYMIDFKAPMVIADSIKYMGNSTTFLAMLVLGAALGRMNLKSVLTNVRLYIFIILRMVALPVAVVLLFSLFVKNNLFIGATALLLATPCASMPLMLAEEYGADTNLLSQGAILSTLCCLFTIPIVALLVG